MRKFIGTIFVTSIGVALIASASISAAEETINFSYDARGRLVQVARSGTVNDGIQASYGYDNADNRSNVTVVGGSILPSFAISDVSVTEGGSLVFTITKTGTTTSSLSVDFSTNDGSATAGTDFSTASGSVPFAPAETNKTVTVSSIDDSIVESVETFTVNLANPSSGSTISDTQGVGTINDNDVPSVACNGVSFSVNDKVVVEGMPLIFTVSKAGATASSCGISFATANGTGVSPTHYTSRTGVLTFAPSQTTATVSVTTIDNFRLSGTRTMFLNLTAPSNGGGISDSQGLGTMRASDTNTCTLCRTSSDPANTMQEITPTTEGN